MRDLTPFYCPRSIAVVGAGERATSSGGAVLQNLIKAGYTGRLVPINPKGGTAFGLTMQPALKSLAEPVDLAVIVIRPDMIVGAVREAAEAGIRNLLILPGGFAEAGDEGRARDAELRELAAAHGLTIAGPNCAGYMHLRPDLRLAPSFLRDLPPGGGLALVSQSGALAEEVIAAANLQRLGFGTIVSVGNAMHLGLEDHLEYLGADEGCSGIFLYAEGIEDPARFRTAAREAAKKKPIVLLIGGRTGQGGRAAAAHTGAVPNSEAALAAFAAECCALRVTSLRRLLLAAKGFSFYPEGIAAKALILSNSGGPGVVCTDQAVLEGLDLVDLPAAMAAPLRAALPGEASVANPIDLLADAREERFGLCFDLAVQKGYPAFKTILGIHVVPFMVDAAPVVQTIAERMRRDRRPQGLAVMHAMMGTLPDKAAWFAALEAAGIPAFNDVEQMAECAGLLAQYPKLRARAASEPPPNRPPAFKGRA
ncbi:MAG TPA: CoA-binding protein [Ferrovibrio sp.]|uniref:CoA-binding protein n=1 Tax=Ferrovibrio sp. TaxID=1917215 RepID=UPI002ED4E68E